MVKMVKSLINAKTLIPVFIIFGLLVIPVSNANSQAILPQSFFLEDPYTDTDVQARGEWISLDNGAGGGSLWLNQFRADINIYENLLGVYVKVPFAGLSGNDNLSGDYDIGNVGVGGKAALISTDSYVLTGGFEVAIPTTSNNNGAAIAAAYFKDFIYFVDDAWTLKPQLIFGTGNGQFGFQANLSGDIMLDADAVEGDSTEFLLEYGGTVSYTPELNTPFATSLLVDLLFNSSLTFDNDITGGYVTPGIRVGGQTVSMGAGVEIPFGSSEITDLADIGVVVDLIFRFGS